MKKLQLLVWLTILSFGCGNSQNNYEIVLSEKFKVKLPCEAKIEIDTITAVKHLIYKCEKGDTGYEVIQSKYTNNMYHSDSLSNIDFDLDYTQRKLLQSGKVRPINAMPKSLKGYPGKEFRFQYIANDNFTFRQIYIVKNTVFELRYTAPNEKMFHNEIDDFFNSFQLLNIEDNNTPYLNLPSEEELSDRPFEANFFGETETVVQIMENFKGKIPVVIEANQIRNTDKSGVVAFVVMYTTLPEDTSEEEKLRFVSEQFEMVSWTYPDAVLIETKESENRKDAVFEYSIGTEKVVDKRITTWTKDKIFTATALFVKDVKEDKRVNEFIESFKVK